MICIGVCIPLLSVCIYDACIHRCVYTLTKCVYDVCIHLSLIADAGHRRIEITLDH